MAKPSDLKYLVETRHQHTVHGRFYRSGLGMSREAGDVS